MSIILIYAKLQVSVWHVLAALCMSYIYHYDFSVNFTSLCHICLQSTIYGRWTSSIGFCSIRGVLKYTVSKIRANFGKL